MWLPNSMYRAAPTYWLLLGLMFVFTGAYVGFDSAWSYVFLATGAACSAWAVRIFSMRNPDDERDDNVRDDN